MDNTVVSTLFKDYVVPFQPGKTLTQVIGAHDDIRLRSWDMAPILKNNPAYQHFILSQQSLSKRVADWNAEDPGRSQPEDFLVNRAAGLLGKAAIRNLVACIRLSRLSPTGLPRRKTDRLTPAQPQQQIPFALKAQSICEEKKIPHAEMAFNAGLHYDFLNGVLTQKRAPKDCKTKLEQSFQHGLRVAEYAFTMIQHLKQVHQGEWLFGCALLIPLGQALMCTQQGWSDLFLHCDRFQGLKNERLNYFEKKHYGITSSELTSMLVLSFDLFSSLEPTIRFSNEPWMLFKTTSNQEQLCMILSIASTLANQENIKQLEKPYLQEYQVKWLEEKNISLHQMISASIS